MDILAEVLGCNKLFEQAEVSGYTLTISEDIYPTTLDMHTWRELLFLLGHGVRRRSFSNCKC